ncbi:MAG: molybdopterin-dependent oxidoreductase [Eggerthellaceae bacterium]|nr:molybdopterin-dependent oxidoreductase [Eggerthellaceae bacterium]
MALLDKTIERRDFLKGSAAVAATVAATGLAGCASSDTSPASGEGAGGRAHEVASDTAIINGEGEWVTVDCWGNCGGRCVNRVFVKDGVVLRQKTDDMKDDSEEHPQQRSCPRGHSMRQHVLNANRVKYPMKRKSWQPGGGANSHGELRGEESWVRITWDEALDYVAQELRRVYDDYGPRSVVCMGTDWPVLNLLGGRLQWNSTESYGNWYNSPVRMGTSLGGGFPDALLGNDRLDLKNADTIVLYGVNPLWHTSGNPMHYYQMAREAGTEFIFVGPEYNVSANAVDARWIRVRPGTDTAFLMAVAYEMIRLDNNGGDVIDWDFLHAYTVGFDGESLPADATVQENFQSYVLGEYDGIPKTPEWAAEICGTPTEDITWYASEMTKHKNVMLLHSYAPSRTRGSIDLPQLFLTVACMGGHLGKPGNSANSIFSCDSANAGTRLVKPGSPTSGGVTIGAGVTSVIIPKNTLEYFQMPKPTIWKDLDEGHYTCYGDYRNGPLDNGWVLKDGMLPQAEFDIDPKIIVNDYHNPLQATEDINRGIKVFKKMDMVVNIDYRFTLTSQYADILLPCFTAWEGNLDPLVGELDVSANGIMRLSRAMCNRDLALFPRPAIQPMFDTKNEDWIYGEIAKRLGFEYSDIYSMTPLQAYFNMWAGAEVTSEDGKTTRPLITFTQDDFDRFGVQGTPQEGLVDFREIWDKGHYQVPRREDDNLGFIGYSDFIADPEANPRKSASGKLEIYCQSKADAINWLKFGPDELKPYPTFHTTTYEQSFEDWETKKAGQYPFIMFQPHYLRRAHTNFDENVWTREALQNPFVISAQDAQKKGVKTGDTVLVFNDAGKMLRIAQVSQSIMPGVVAAPHGARTYLDLETGIDHGGNENMLVDHKTQDDYLPLTDSYNSCLVDFEKYDGEPLQPDCLFEPALWTEE